VVGRELLASICECTTVQKLVRQAAIPGGEQQKSEFITTVKLGTSMKISVGLFVKAVVITATMMGSALTIAAEAVYDHGHGALEIFDGAGMAATPAWVQVWLALLLSCFAVGLLFSWKHPLARWAVGGFIVSATTGAHLFALLDLPFLSGSIAIMHIICLSPALTLLLLKRPFLDANETKRFRVWSATMAAFILFSFIFDIKDAAIYLNHIAGAA